MTSVRSTLICLAVLSQAAGICFAQAQPSTPNYSRTLCIKALPGKSADYEKLTSDIIKKTTQARADAKELSLWLFQRSTFPAGASATCDFMTITAFSGFPPDPKAVMSAETALEKAHVSMKTGDMVEKRNTLARLERVELWQAVDVIGRAEPGSYVRFDYMKVEPGRISEWMKREREIYKPVHQARMEQGALSGWAAIRLFLPSGSGLPYNALTANMFPNWKAVSGLPGYQQAQDKAHPGANWAEINEQTAKVRDIVRSELYEVLQVVRPAGAASAGAAR